MAASGVVTGLAAGLGGVGCGFWRTVLAIGLGSGFGWFGRWGRWWGVRLLVAGFGLGHRVGCWAQRCWVRVAADGVARWAWTMGQLLGLTALGAEVCGWSIVLGVGRDLGSGVGCGRWVCWGHWRRVWPWVAGGRRRAGAGIPAAVWGAAGGFNAERGGAACGCWWLMCPGVEGVWCA